jgi:hypothetical protein
MITLKSFTIVAALLAGGTSLAMAQNGLPTGGQPPVAGGAAGNPITNPGYYGGYYATGGYIAAPGYALPGYAAPGYVAPGYVAPGYAQPVAQPDYVGAEAPAAVPGTVTVTHRRSMYMYVPPHRINHRTQKIAPATNE